MDPVSLLYILVGALTGALAHLWVEVRALRKHQIVLMEAIVALQPDDEDELDEAAHAALVALAGQYGCTVIPVPAGEVYATQGQGEC